jgi:hypothetical protein
LNEKIKLWRVRTTVRAGESVDRKLTPLDRAMFVLLDALQKPTDWAYAQLTKKT